MEKGKVLLGLFMFFIYHCFSYDAEVSSPFYRITLWKDGDPRTSVVVEGYYEKLDHSGKFSHPECDVYILKEKKDEDTFWRISVIPKEEWGVYSVSFPILFLPRIDNGYFIYPRDMGMKLDGLFSRGNRPWPAGYAGIHKPPVSCIYYGRYPETVQMLQMLMIENKDEGVMVWTQDSEGWVKDFVVSAPGEKQKGKGVQVEIIHYPENTGQKGTGFKSPYPVVTTPYKGGWYSAAQIYREWAIKQPWCAKGKIYNRPTTPEWFKETHFWRHGGWFYDMEKGFEQFKKFQENLNGKHIGAILNQWQKYYQEDVFCPDYFPPHDIPSFQRLLSYQKKGIHIGPYITSFHVTTDHYLYRYLENRVARDASGNPYDYYIETSPQREKEVYQGEDIRIFKRELKEAWNGPVSEEIIEQLNHFSMPDDIRENQKKLLSSNWGKDISVIDKLQFYYKNQWLCPGDDRVINLYRWIADQFFGVYKTDMMYFDVAPIPVFPCLDKRHTHPAGIGSWMIKSQHLLFSKILEKYPGAIICSETMAEYMLDVIHHYYMKDYAVERAIPLFSTIYQGFVEYSSFPVCGKEWGKGWDNPDDFAAFVALSLHWGYAGGGCSVDPPATIAGYEKDDIRWRFLNEAIDIRLKYREFIAAGRRLKDPEIEGVPVREFKGWRRPGSEDVIRMKLPVIQVSKWAKNNDETKGILLISNSSGDGQSVNIEGNRIEMEPYSWKVIEIDIK